MNAFHTAARTSLAGLLSLALLSACDKAPFNQIKNEPRLYTYKHTAVLSPNSDASSVLPPGKGTWGPPPVRQAD